jgi:hypothetical protein
MGELIFIIIISTIITERLLEGLHKFYWTRQIKIYLVGENDGHGILEDGPLREFIRCKFCQSWWAAWGISLVVIWVSLGWSWHWVWVGLIVGSLANKLHDLCHSIKAMRDRGL